MGARKTHGRASAERLRVLVMSHSHPKRTSGGAEISAQALFLGLREMPEVSARFLGCSHASGEARLGARLSQPFGHDDFVYTPGRPFMYFNLANRDAEFPKILGDLVRDMRPHVVHAHHYLQFGVEAFAVIKRASPDTRIVLSLHEYFAICNNNGQMVKTRSHRLCSRESPAECAACFPELAPRDFFLRKLYVQSFLKQVDMFVSPSRFLAERYVAWGVPAAKMQVLENVARADLAEPSIPPALRERDRGQIRVGFFGQMSPLKGISVLIEAAKQLSERRVGNLVIEIHGDPSNQPLPFQTAVATALEQAGRNVSYEGPYDNMRVHALMQSVDAVVVPSIWWENSPVVIQEALANGKPVICSDIGGMAEKVRNGVDGLHFKAGSASSLAETLARLASRPDILLTLAQTLGRPLAPRQALDAHLALYAKLPPTERIDLRRSRSAAVQEGMVCA